MNNEPSEAILNNIKQVLNDYIGSQHVAEETAKMVDRYAKAYAREEKNKWRMENYSFKGTESEYSNLHKWVAAKKGKPQKCERCGDTSNRRYHWANISNLYKKEVSDWERLCVPCHSKKDGNHNSRKTECPQGHEYTPDNISYRSNGGRVCKTCNRERVRLYSVRKRINS